MCRHLLRGPPSYAVQNSKRSKVNEKRGLLCVEVGLKPRPHFSYEENSLVNQVEFVGLACTFETSVT